MKYWGYHPNDFVNGSSVCVSLWTTGCPHKCHGCFNKETWDFFGGYDVPEDLPFQIIKAINVNGIQRNFSVLGGEPLCLENAAFVLDIIRKVRAAYPHIKIFVWTGYTLETLPQTEEIKEILSLIDVLIDGPFIEEKRNLTLPLRGSENQRVLTKGLDF